MPGRDKNPPLFGEKGQGRQPELPRLKCGPRLIGMSKYIFSGKLFNINHIIKNF